MVQKNAYYINFDNEKFLGAKELLKRMPVFYNRVYFSSKYANVLWSNDKEEIFNNVVLLCKLEDIQNLRQIIKNNFLYINDWDSIKFIEDKEYGFSFIGGNILFIIIPFEETEEGYHIMSYEYDSGICSDTYLKNNKEFFLTSSINDLGEIIKICDFKLEDMTEENTKKTLVPKKTKPEMIIYDKKGYTKTNTYSLLLIMLICILLVWLIAFFMKM